MWISAAAAVPLIVLTMGEFVGLPVRDWIGHQMASYLEFALATPIILWAALPFFKRGWDSVVNRVAQHVDADQPRCGGGLSLFAGGDLPARRVSGSLPDGAWCRHLLSRRRW